MATPFDDWLKGYEQTPNVMGEQPTAVLEPSTEPASFDEWLKAADVEPMTLGEQAAEVGKAALRMPEYVAANVGDVIGWFAERGAKGILPKYHPLSLVSQAAEKLLPRPWQEMNERSRQRMVKFANNVSAYWRKAAAAGVEAKDPRIDALSWSEAPVLKGLVSGIESSGTFLTAVAAGIITKNPTLGLAILGAASGGGTYRELREAGVDEELANATALLVGTFEAVTEKLPFDAIFGKSSKRLLTKFLKSASFESLQEFFQNMGENYFTHFAKEYQETGEVGESLKIEWAQLMENWQEAIAGGIVMGGAGAVMTGRAGLGAAEEERAPSLLISEEEQRSMLMSFARGVALQGMRTPEAAGAVELAVARNDEQVAAEEIAARLGKKIIWFSDPAGEFGITGAVSPVRPSVMFMDVDAERAAASTMAHEILHHLKTDAPELYAKLSPLIRDVAGPFEEFIKRPAVKGLSAEAQNEEFVAEMFSQAARQPGFWDKAFQADASLVEKLWQIIKDVVNRLTAATRDVEVDEHLAPYLEEFVAIEKLAAEAARKYAPIAKEQANVRLVRRLAVQKQQAGEKLTPTEEKALEYTEAQLRDMRAEKFRGDIKFSQRESVNRRIQKITSQAQGVFSEHAWTFFANLSYEQQLAPNTAAAYLTAVRDFSKYIYLEKPGFKSIQTVRPEDLRAFKRSMSKAGKSAATINQRMAGLNEFFGFLTMTDQIAGNPMLALADELVKREEKLPRVLSVKQMFRFVKAVRERTRPNLQKRNSAMAEMLWATGARATEVIDVKIADLRLSEGLMVLHGKGGKDRLVPINPSTVRAFTEHITEAGLSRNDYLFQTRNGDQMTRQDIGRFVKQYAKKAGLPSWVSPHTLRHTFATHLMEAGVDIRFIQEMMGHTTPEITALYAHVTIQRKKAVFKKYHPSEVGVLKRAKLAKKERAVTRRYVVTREGKLQRIVSKKKQIARETGMEVEARIVSEEAALKARMHAQKTAAAAGYKAGLAMGKEKAVELKARYKTLAEWRKAFRKYVKQSLPRDVQGTMLTALEGIKGEKSYERALKKLVAKIEQVQSRQALTRLQKQVKKITKKWGRKGTFGGYKLLPQYEKILDDLTGWFTTKREMAEEKRADLNELLQWAIDEQEALEAKGQTDTPYQQFDVVPTIRKLQKELGDVSVANWPAEKIDQITDALLTIVYQHLYEREAFNQAMKRRLDADIAQGVKDISEAAGRPQEPTAAVGPDAPKGLVTRAGEQAKALVGRHNYNLSTLSKIISGMKEKGPVWRRLAGALEVGVGRAIEQTFAAEDMLQSMMEEKGITAREVMSWSKLLRRASWQGPAWVKKLADLDIDFEDKTAVFIKTKFISIQLENGQQLKLTVAEALDIYMHTRNPDNYKVLTGKNGVSFYGKPVKEGQVFTPDDVNNITEVLFAEAPKARDMVDIIETVLAHQQDAINITSRQLLGYDLATLPGYWHIRRLLPKVARGKKAAFTYETVEGRSHWRERVGGPHPLVLGDVFNNLIETVEVGAEYVGMAESLRNAKTMLSDKNFRDSAEKQGFGKYVTDISWQIGQLEKSSAEREWAERWLSGWQRNVTRAIFGFNLRLAAQQEISVFLAFSQIPFKYARELRPYVTKDVVARIVAWSPYIRHRFEGHVSREIGDTTRTGGVLRFVTGKDQYSDYGTWLVKHFDKRAIVNVWRMVEAEVADRGEFGHLTRKQLYKNGAYQAQVAERAVQVLRDTQPTWHKVDRSLIGSSPNMSVRMLTMFHSQREKMVQMVGQANAVYRNSEKTQKDKITLSRTYGMIALNLALINAWKVAFGVLIMRKKDEPEEWATNVLADIPGMFYIVGAPLRESVKAASRAWRGKPVYQLGVVSLPALKILETGKLTLTAWEKVALEALSGNNVEKELLQALDKTWEFSQYALGLPFHSTTQIAKKWSD